MNTSSVNSAYSTYPNVHPGNNKTSNSNNDSPESQRQQIEKLAARDREVKNHEQAHLNAVGAYATSTASFTYQTGPDGKRYAIGGEVQIDTSEIPNNPEASLHKAEIIRRAALAPAQPSGQDRAVAQSASAMMMKAHMELIQQTKLSGANGSDPNSKTASNFNHTV